MNDQEERFFIQGREVWIWKAVEKLYFAYHSRRGALPARPDYGYVSVEGDFDRGLPVFSGTEEEVRQFLRHHQEIQRDLLAEELAELDQELTGA